MGGVHSCMTSGLYPGAVATAPLLAPRSAAVAYCDGPMAQSMAWKQLLADADAANNSIHAVVMAAGQAIDIMREASYALELLEAGPQGQGHEQQGGSSTSTSGNSANSSVPSDAGLGSVIQQGGDLSAGPSSHEQPDVAAVALPSQQQQAPLESAAAAQVASAGNASPSSGRQGSVGPRFGGIAAAFAARQPWRFALRRDQLFQSAQEALDALERSQVGMACGLAHPLEPC